jgi:DNA repair exonuclease SbcCD nuclease subunit
MSKILILGDVHLGKGISLGRNTNGDLNSRIKDQLVLLNWVLDKAIELEITSIVITGDVYQDPKPHPTIINLFMEWLKRCEKNKVHIHIIMGNHDMLRSGNYTMSALDLVPIVEVEATFYKNISVQDIGGLKVLLIPYRDKRMYDAKTSDEAISKLENEIDLALGNNIPDVVIGHLTLEGSLHISDEISDSLNELYVPFKVFKKYKHVWMGHIHHPQVLNNENPHLAHIGSMDRSDFSKSELAIDKVCVVFDGNTYEYITLPTRPIRHIKVEVPTGKDSTEFVINSICLMSKQEIFDSAIVRLEIQLNGSDVENVQREKIEQYLYEHLKIYHISDFTETRLISAIQLDPDEMFDNTISVSQAINKWADSKKELFDSDEQKEKFKALANSIRQQYEEKVGK